MLEKLKQYQEHWATLSEPEREIAELLATREILQGDMVDEDGDICTLWDYAVNTQVEELSAETGLARDTDEDPEDVHSILYSSTVTLPNNSGHQLTCQVACRSSRASQDGCFAEMRLKCN